MPCSGLSPTHLCPELRQSHPCAPVGAATPRRASTKYKDVSSKVVAGLERPVTAPARPRAERLPLGPRNFVAGRPTWQANQAIAEAWNQPTPLSTLSPQDEEKLGLRSKLKPPVPMPDLSPRAAPSVDFVRRNASQAGLAPRRAELPSQSSRERKGPHHGTLPPYLLDRKMELAQMVAEKEQSDALRGMPSGHHMLREEERVRILGAVRESHAKASLFPIAVAAPLRFLET